MQDTKKKAQRVSKNATNKAAKLLSNQVTQTCCAGHPKSDIYNTGTLIQFSGNNRQGLADQRASFLETNYRLRNIQTVAALESCSYQDNPTIQKICKGLSCCSYLSEVEISKNGHASVRRTSSKCKRPEVCPRCAAIQASKYKHRLVAAYNSSEYQHLFKNKYFYFMTFTLKHNLIDTRTGVYLDELNGYFKQLTRSKLWKKYFPYTKINPKSGYVKSIENTIKVNENGHHIHIHVLVCCPPIKARIMGVQQEFRDKWLSITGDSTGVSLDMVKVDNETRDKIQAGELPKKLAGVLKELMKYTIKVGDTQNMTVEKADMLSEWLIAAKDKNTINAGGFFRGMQLFTRKSKLDDSKEVAEPYDHSDSYDYKIGRTCDINFNFSKSKTYHKKERRRILEAVYLKSLGNSFIDANGCGEFFDDYLNLSLSDADFGSSTGGFNASNYRVILGAWIEFSRARNGYNEDDSANIEEVVNVAPSLPRWTLFDSDNSFRSKIEDCA